MPTFAEATVVQPKSSHTYRADFVEGWTIGTVPHGGYVTSCFLAVISKHFSTTLARQNQPHTIACHLSFLRRTQLGPAHFTVKDIKLGRQASVVHVTLFQDDREEVVGYFTQSNILTERGVTFPTYWNLHPPPQPVENFTALEQGRDPIWGERGNWPGSDFRKAPKNLRAWFPRRGQPTQACMDMWYCFADAGSRFTNESLGFVCDMFPQVVESYLLDGLDSYSVDFESRYTKEQQRKIIGHKASMWYPTVLLNLDVKKALPAEGAKWLFVRLEAKLIKNGRYDLEVMAFDQGGDLVAISNHVCFAVGAERNLAERRKVENGSTKL